MKTYLADALVTTIFTLKMSNKNVEHGWPQGRCVLFRIVLPKHMAGKKIAILKR
jgi:hypothetical protein